MRRFVLCFLICLLPLRLWAGAWMPMTQGLELPQSTFVSSSSAHHPTALVDADHHGCHEALPLVQAMEASGAADALGALKGDVQLSDCHDGSCQLCGMCHQSAHVAVWPWVVSVPRSYSLPLGPSRQPAGQAFAPPLKPPIS